MIRRATRGGGSDRLGGRRALVAAGLTVLATLAMSACGSSERDPQADGSAFSSGAGQAVGSSTPAATPSGLPPGWGPDPARKAVGKYATYEPLVRAPAVVRAAASARLLAVANGDTKGLTLRVGKPTTSGPLVLTKAKGADLIPYWARIHVGTDRRGRPVVTYPRCTSDQFGTCEAVAWSPDDEREVPLDGLEGVGGVIEAAENSAFIAFRSTAGGSARDPDRAPEPRLMMLERGKAIRSLPGPPPESIELHGSTLAAIRSTSSGDGDPGICGLQDVALWNLRAPDAQEKVVDEMICGLGGQYLSGVALDRTSTRITMAANGLDDHAQLRRYDATTGKLTKRRMPGEPPVIVWLDGRHGITIGFIEACGARIDPRDPATAEDLGDCPIGRMTLRQP